MLIPHDRGDRVTLTLSAIHFWTVVGVIAVLAFSSAFFLQRSHAMSKKNTDLRAANRSLELKSSQQQPTVTGDTAPESLQALEEQLRSEYETNIQAITAQLSDLYDVEAKARAITQLAPRDRREEKEEQGKGGRGSGLITLESIMPEPQAAEILRPDSVIYGHSRPSADLIQQEINVRMESFSELVLDMEARIDSIERIPCIWPLVGGLGRISSSYGNRRDPFTKRIRFHSGMDISSSYATRIKAAAKGKVVESSYERNGYGYYLIVDHGNGITTLYAHMSKRLVEVGDEVQRGDVIGRVGNTGRSTGNHVHYEVRINGKTVNPKQYLGN